jgi:hypothetical protein
VKERSLVTLYATVLAFVALQFSTSLAAQVLSPQQPEEPVTASENAAVVLPEAPIPQAALQSAQAAAQAPASTSAQQTATPIPPAQPCTVSQPAVADAAPASPAAGAAASDCPPATGVDPADAKEKAHEEAERELKVEEKQRLLGVMPQFQVVMGGKAVPLTGGEKWRLALHSAIDPFYIGWALVIGGGYAELVGSHNGYGWGADGYIKRVGANYADNVNGALIGNALLPQLLHQDPRYFRKGTGSIKSRFLYAAASTVICHGDNGKWQPNVSNVLGNFISGGISNAYYPENERGMVLTIENGISVTLFGALGGQILEFGPDLQRLVKKRRHHPAPPAPAPGTASTPALPASPSTQPDSH